MIVFLAARNVVRRRRRSLLVVGLIAAVVALLFFGNSILESTDRGLSRSFAESFTGDLAVAAASPRSFGIFGDETPAIGEYTPLPIIREFPAVMEILGRVPEIRQVTPLISGPAVIDLRGTRRSLPVFGIDASTYFEVFPRLILTEGKLPAQGQAGALIYSSRAVEIEARMGHRPVVGDPVILNMFGKRGFRIEEVPLMGIVDFEISNPLLESTVLVNAQTLRALLGLTLGKSVEYQPPEQAASLLDTGIQNLFQQFDEKGESTQEEFSLQEVTQILAESSSQPIGIQSESGAWHFVLLRLEQGANASRVRKQLNRAFRSEGLSATAMGWRKTAGMSARMVVLLRLVYNVGFLLFALAAIIVMVNLLVIQLIERTGEIGTIRALGATERFMQRLLITETMLLSACGGLLGVVVGGAMVFFLRAIHLELDNRLLQTLFGGSSFYLTLSPIIALLSILTAILIGILSCIYPVHLALRVQPARSLSVQ